MLHMRTAPHGTAFGAAWHGFRLFATRPLKKLRRRRAPKPSAWTDLMAVVSCLCLIVLIQAWASANSAHASWHGLLSLVRPLRSKVNTPESKRQAPPFARTGPALPPHTPLTHPPCLYARSLSDLDLAAGALAWVPLRALQPRAGGPVAPLVSPLHAIIRPAPLHAAPFVRGARLAALRRAFSSAPCPPWPNKRRAP